MVFILFLFLCPFMVINLSIQYYGGFLPDIILLALCDEYWGTHLTPHHVDAEKIPHVSRKIDCIYHRGYEID